MFTTPLSKANKEINIYIYICIGSLFRDSSFGERHSEEAKTLLKNISKWMEQMEVRMQETPGGSEGSAEWEGNLRGKGTVEL